MEPKVFLRNVDIKDKDVFFAEKKIALKEGREFGYCFDLEKPFHQYVAFLKDLEIGKNLSPGDVQGTTFVVENEESIAVGTCSVRHELNDFLRQIGGHIGYTIFTPYRRKGYGTATLRECLRFAKEKLGFSKALLTCDEENIPSRKIIETCGGVFEGVYDGPRCKTIKRRYWVPTSKG